MWLYIDVAISPTPLTDHKAIHIKINLSTSHSNRPHSVYWKLNSSLLSHEMVKEEVADLIMHYQSKAKVDKQYCINWELLKFELGIFFRKYSSDVAKSRRAEELTIVSKITFLSSKSPDTLADDEKLELSKLQTELNEIYNHKAKGAFIRSRARWLEEGEQNSHYFFNLEKYHSTVNNIHKLNVDGVLTDDFKLISNYCSRFYTKLYSSGFCQAKTEAFLNSFTIKKITEDEMLNCDSSITIGEVKDIINTLKNNKSPGIDGLISEFYKLFSIEIAPFLYEVFVESINKGQLPTTMTQGLTTLIPKANKDATLLDN